MALTEEGYLVDPENASAWWNPNPNLVQFSDIAEKPCLVLLGEPGAGKSWTIRGDVEALAREGHEARLVDLGAYGTEARLMDNVFASDWFNAWKAGSHTLHLFLDSFDECQVEIRNLCKLVVTELSRTPRERLCLRLISRTAEWTQHFRGYMEEELSAFWGGAQVAHYELAPLRRGDIRVAVAARGLEPDSTLAQFESLGVSALAVRPITLNFLIARLRAGHTLDGSRAQLYEEGCLELSNELNTARLSKREAVHLTGPQRMEVAKLLAVLMLPCGRPSVFVGASVAELSPSDLGLDEFMGVAASFGPFGQPLSRATVEEVMATALFTARGSDRLGWAHQTLMEYLASSFCLVHLDLTQLTGLITLPDGHLVPQMKGLAAWVAEQSPSVFDEILLRDPWALLQVDLRATDAARKELLVEELLKACRNESDQRIQYTHAVLSRLAHPTIANQLARWLQSSTDLVTRRWATNVARACKATSLVPVLQHILLDVDEDSHLRRGAAEALVELGDIKTKVILRTFVTDEHDDDPDDELKGIALHALWPELLTSEELFQSITLPKNSTLIGVYKIFLYNLGDRLRASDLPAAAAWLSNIDEPTFHVLDDAVYSVLLKAWTYRRDQVFQSFIPAFMRGLDLTLPLKEPTIEDLLVSDEDTRKGFVQAFLRPTPPVRFGTDYHRIQRLLRTSDTKWFLEQYFSEQKPAARTSWAQLLLDVAQLNDAPTLELLLDSCGQDSELRDRFAPQLMPVQLNSPEAERLRSQFERWQKWQYQQEEEPVEDRTAATASRVMELLDKCESGETAAWWQLNWVMAIGPQNYAVGEEFEADLRRTPGWGLLTGDSKDRVLNAARLYLQHGDPHASEWLGTNTLHRPALAGYRALFLLYVEDRSSFDALDIRVWRKWAPTVVCPFEVGREQDVHHDLIQRIYALAPDECLSALLATLPHDDQTPGGSVYHLWQIESIWDDRVENALITYLIDTPPSADQEGTLLRALARYGSAKGVHHVTNRLAELMNGSEKNRATGAAIALLASADEANWSIVWPYISGEHEFGRSVIELYAREEMLGSAPSIGRTSEQQQADLYLWLVNEYPPSEDPQYEEAHQVTTRDMVGHLRDSLIQSLGNSASDEACAALQRIVDALREATYIKGYLRNVQDRSRAQKWKPPMPRTVLELVANHERRFVQGSGQLSDAVWESLQRLQSKLRGETPAVVDIWNIESISGGKRYWPKDELALSDYIKRYLDEDLRGRGIIANREVEVRRGLGNTQGERTDVHVDAVTPDGKDVVTLVIEVKGCWNNELMTAMKTQLLDRYMEDGNYLDGIYLVGWFNSPQWYLGDGRRSVAMALDRSEVETSLTGQAAELSNERRLRTFMLDATLP